MRQKINAQKVAPSVNSFENSAANEISAAPLPPGRGMKLVANVQRNDIARIVTILTVPVGLNAR